MVDSINLSIGKAKIKPLTTGMVDKAINKSTIINDQINNNLLLYNIEKQIYIFPKKRFFRYRHKDLPYKDGRILRKHTKQILVDNDLWTETVEEKQKFHPKDIEWFNKQKTNVVKKYGGC